MGEASDTPDKLNDALQQAAAGLDFLKQLEQQEQAEQEAHTAAEGLRAALESQPPRKELIRVYQALLAASSRAGLDVDAGLIRSYRERMDQLRTTARRRLRRWGKIASGVILLCAVVVAGGLYWSHRQSVSRAVVELERWMEKEQFAEAHQYVEQLRNKSRWVVGNPRVQELASKIQESIGKEQRRAADFREALKTAETGSVEKPDHAALAKVGKLAKGASETAQVQKLEQGIKDREQARQKERSQRLKSELDALVREIEAFKQLEPTEAADRGIAEFEKRLQGMGKEAGNSNVPLDTNRAEERLKALQDRRQRAVQLQSAETAIAKVAEAGDFDAYVAALKGYVATFPKERNGADFAEVLKEEPLWKGMEAWNEAAKAWGSFDLHAATPDGAAAQLKKLNETATAHAGFPQMLEFWPLVSCLKAIANRADKAGQSPRELLETMLGHPAMSGLWELETTTGKRYYARTELTVPPESGKPFTFRYLSGIDGQDKALTLEPKEIAATRPAVHCELAEKARRELKGLKGNATEWERVFCSIVQEVVACKTVDPLLKFVLLRRILREACQGSYPLAIGFSEQLKAIGSAGILPKVNWLDPDDPAAVQPRLKARTVLEALPDVKPAQETTRQWNQLAGTKVLQYFWLGCLLRKSAGKEWECVHRPLNPTATGRLVVIRKQEKGIELADVGQVKDGQITFDTAASDAFRAGRPVFGAAPP